MDLTFVHVFIICILQTYGQLFQRLFEQPSAKTINQRRLDSGMNENYALTIYDLFGDQNSNKLIFVPGASVFITPSQLIKHESKTVTSHTTEIKSSFGPFESKIVHSSEIRSKIRSSPRFNPSVETPSHSTGVDNFFDATDRVHDNTLPSVLSNLQHARIPADEQKQSKSILERNVQNLNTRHGWNEDLERLKWMQAIEEAKMKPNAPILSRSMARTPDMTMSHKIHLRGMAPTQKLVTARRDLGSFGTDTASEDSQLLQLITQGLHPLQELVSDNGKARTDSDGAQEEGKSEIPGLHSLQEYADLDSVTNDGNSNLLNPIGSDTPQVTINSEIQPFQSLRQQKILEATQTDDKHTFGLHAFKTTQSALIEQHRSFFKQPSSKNVLPSQINEPVFNFFSVKPNSERRPLQIKGYNTNQPSQDGFGLRHGINNHHNFVNSLTLREMQSPDPEIVPIDHKSIGLSSSHATEQLTHSKRGSSHGVVSEYPQTRESLEGWNYQVASIPISASGTQGLLLKDTFPVDISRLPALELTEHYLPVATVSNTNPDNSDVPKSSQQNQMHQKTFEPRKIFPWISNIIIPAVSLNSFTEKNIKETSQYVNMHGHLVDKITETRHHLNITQQYKPLVQKLLNSPPRQRSVPLMVSKSRSIPVSADTQTRHKQNMNNSGRSIKLFSTEEQANPQRNRLQPVQQT